MKTFLKPLFDWLTGGYTLFNDPLYNYISMAIVGFIAFIIAWKVVGSLYKEDVIESSAAGSIIHWIVKFISFFILFSAVSMIFRVVKFLISIPLWIWLIIVGIVIVGIVLFVIIKRKRKV